MALILVFHNDGTGGETDANYNVQVMVGDGTVERTHTIATGRVEGHNRSHGWSELVRQFMDIPVPTIDAHTRYERDIRRD